jgi:hypothetical protein
MKFTRLEKILLRDCVVDILYFGVFGAGAVYMMIHSEKLLQLHEFWLITFAVASFCSLHFLALGFALATIYRGWRRG